MSMSNDGIKVELLQGLKAALYASVTKISEASQPGEVYAFVVYASQNFQDLGVAYSTRKSLRAVVERGTGLSAALLEMLKEHPDLLAAHGPPGQPVSRYEVQACDWQFVSAFPEVFLELNAFIDPSFRGVTGQDRRQVFEEALVSALAQLKTEGLFGNPIFEEDILLGVQFPEPVDLPLVIRVSEALNSAAWHEKIRLEFATS
ncbi:MAG: hypothetical protein ACI9VR_001787 [Cognaticolwellia sp.]|jgi:hypothetical protein